MVDEVGVKENAIDAAKWSSITEVVSKIVRPVTTMILARILAPEAFGVVATVSMIISFVDMFTDAGFQKYLVQQEFENDDHKNKCTTVAFWTNLGISMFLWGIVALFREPIAILVGNPGLGNVVAIACVQLPLTSFSSIQMALYRRHFEFKTLFMVRLISICIPFVVTIPLAFIGLNYWALIIGTISAQLSNAVILTIKSNWKPTFFYSTDLLRKMISFSVWSLLESISIWFSAWVDMFVVGRALSPFYLGLYNTSLNIVNSLLLVVTASVIPVLFAALSRLQNDETAFQNAFYRVQSIVAYMLFPMGLGMMLYSGVATRIILGEKWVGADFVIGVWALVSGVKIVLSDFNSECYRAKGLPRLSFLLQMLHLAFLIPTCVIAVRYGFKTLVYARALVRFELVISSLWVMQYIMHIPIKGMLRRIYKPTIFTIIMGILAVGLKQISSSMIWSLFSIVICFFAYLGMVMVYAREDYDWIMGRVLPMSGKRGPKRIQENM